MVVGVEVVMVGAYVKVGRVGGGGRFGGIRGVLAEEVWVKRRVWWWW